MSTLKVGDKIWHFDGNRRVYPPKKPGEIFSSGGPIYRHHWHEVEITGETSRSWVTLYGRCPKARDHHGWALTASEVEDDCWANSHRYAIQRMVERCSDPAKLKQIAAIVGFTP